MATNPQDVFAALRVDGGAPAPEAPDDVFAPLRRTAAPEPLPVRNTLGEEFQAGLGQGIDSLQGSLYGVAALTGRELGIGWLEDAGMEGAAKNLKEAGGAHRESAGFTDIKSAGGFFKWAAASMGEAVPSLAAMATGGGIGAVIGKKSVELGVKRAVARKVERQMVVQFGMGQAEAMTTTRNLLRSELGQDMIAKGFLGQRRAIQMFSPSAMRLGGALGAGGASALQQTGAIDQELIRAGIIDPGITAVFGGVLGGALDTLPAARLIHNLFPGVKREVSKQFIKDFAVAAGVQIALEGPTEGAQEVIAMAALSYHDPSFDMTSPDAIKRVIDAFAVGALVGAVTGGVSTVPRHVGPALRKLAEVPRPTLPEWKLDRTRATDDDFVPADNTVIEEIRDRIYGTVEPKIDAAINGLRNQVQRAIDTMDGVFAGGVNPETQKFSQLVVAAHNKFIEDHKQDLASLRKFADEQAARLGKVAETIKDPKQRAKYIEDGIADIKEKLAPLVERIQRAADTRDNNTAAEVDNMDIDDEILEELGVEGLGTTEEGEIVGGQERRESAEVGEIEAPIALTFGRNQKTPQFTVEGGEPDVTGYKKLTDARKGLANLRKRFPNSTDEDFVITKRGPKDFVIETQNVEIKKDQKFWDDLQAARDSAARPKRTQRNMARQYHTEVDGSKFGFKFTNLNIDMKTAALRGKNLDDSNDSLQKGFLAFAGELLTRDVINLDQFNEMNEKFQREFGETEEKVEAHDKVGNFPEKGIAQAEMINFRNALQALGYRIPFKLFGVSQNQDGTWGYSIEDTRAWKSLSARDPAQAADITARLKRQRRQDILAESAMAGREFSGNVVGLGAGDVDVRGVTRTDPTGETRRDIDADARGTTAGEPLTRKVGETRRIDLPVRDEEGKEIFVERGAEPTEAGVFVDVDPQAGDLATDPATKVPEFADTSDPSVRNRKRRAKENARELSKHDQKLLKRWGTKGAVKILLGHDFDADGTLTKAISDLTNFVTKTLGLSNQITVVDEVGLSLLIETGAVSDPAFKRVLAENKPANIRLHDNSFIFLPRNILANPATTVLALGHELGHHLYQVAWDKLTPEGQKRLRRSSKAKTDAEFNEWMADQLAAWITQRRGPRGEVESFFAKVGGQVRRLYDFIKGRKDKRFKLTQTFSEFADAVALKARHTANPGVNPFNETQLKAWFADGGVTMYKWFGETMLDKDGKPLKSEPGAKTTQRKPEVDNMAFDFQPVTEEGRKALARVAKNYPEIAKRAVPIRNWLVNAYKVALAPSTGVIRDIGKRIKVANRLVTMFNREEHGVAKKGRNYHQSVNAWKAQFLDGETGYLTIMKDVPQEERVQMAQRLQKADGDRTAEFTPMEQKIRDLFDRMHAYATEAKLPVNWIPNYFPRSLSRDKLNQGKQEILDHLMDTRGFSLEKARHIYNSLIDPTANDGRATFDATEAPGMRAMNSRTKGIGSDPFFDQYLDDNLDGIVLNYVNQVVKRSEFNKRLGEPMPAVEGGLNAREAIKQGLWDPKGRMHRILKQAHKEGATDEEIVLMEKYIDANLGQLGRDDLKPGTRKWMAGIIAYQNMRVLLFTVFASLPDLAGPSIRSGNMGNSWRTLRDNMHDIAKTDGDLAKMARALGVINTAANEHVMTEYVDNHYMPPVARKMNEAFFRWTGLNWYTDFTRKAALAVGIDWMQDLADIMDAPQNTVAEEKAFFTARDMLAEVGLTQQNVRDWQAAGKPTFNSQSHELNGVEQKVAEALVQFVDESIMRPNASQRPMLASDPRVMLVYHLKNYLYSVHDIILKRIKFNIDEAQGDPVQTMAAIAPAIAMVLLTAMGLELRELVQYAGSNRKPPTDRMDGWEYTFELMQRSGLTGISQLALDFEGAEDRGMSHIAGIGGPTLSQIGTVLSRPSTQTIPKAIPVIGQIPALRNVVRTVL